MIDHSRINASEGGTLIVCKSEDGDVEIAILGEKQKLTLRFCTFNGGGKCPETRKALTALMEAMERDKAMLLENSTLHKHATESPLPKFTPPILRGNHDLIADANISMPWTAFKPREKTNEN